MHASVSLGGEREHLNTVVQYTGRPLLLLSSQQGVAAAVCSKLTKYYIRLA
jgi:hypothetical protein